MIAIYIILVLILLVLTAAIFANKTFVVQREILIPGNSNDIYEYLRFLRNHKSFSKWTNKDPGKAEFIKGYDGTVGFKQSWHNYEDKAGVGELEIKELKSNQSIKLFHHYQKPIKGFSESDILLESNSGTKTLIKWTYTGHTRYPMNLLISLMNMDKIVGKDLEHCLTRLHQTLTS
jgi:hypothetical protein